jgi:hypothetical protein
LSDTQTITTCGRCGEQLFLGYVHYCLGPLHLRRKGQKAVAVVPKAPEPPEPKEETWRDRPPLL